jgi:uncharacterized membrane protein
MNHTTTKAIEATKEKLGFGRRIASPRFVMFCVLLPAAILALKPLIGTDKALLAGFDVAAVAFLVSMLPLLRHQPVAEMRTQAEENDANRGILLIVTGAVMLAVMASVTWVLTGEKNAYGIALSIGTLLLAWTFSHVVYALHYAHLFYGDADKNEKGDGGIDFPECDEPDYWEFLYLSFALGMTFQPADIRILTKRLRRTVLGHSIAAFVFNLGVVAFTINIISG